MPEAPAIETFDVVVIGSEAGGLTAAVCAAVMGLRALVLEKAIMSAEPLLGQQERRGYPAPGISRRRSASTRR